MIGYVLLIITAFLGFLFNLYLYTNEYLTDEYIVCYHMSFSLFFCHLLLSINLFHSWIQFNFSTIISSYFIFYFCIFNFCYSVQFRTTNQFITGKKLKVIFRIIRSIMFIMIIIMIILTIIQHTEDIPLPISFVIFHLLIQIQPICPIIIYVTKRNQLK